jgi:chromosome partitioning protein
VLRETYREHIWNGVIPVDTRLREASKVGLPPPVADPRGKGVEAYAVLLEMLQSEPKSIAVSGVAQ